MSSMTHRQLSGLVSAGLALAVCLLMAAPAAAQVGGSFDLSWHAVPGGSSTCTGGTYGLSGAFGQAATTVLSGGAFRLNGGFWTFPTPIPGDINADGHVNVVDLLYMADAYGSAAGTPRYPGASDLNQDGSVDTFDLLILAATFGRA